MKVKRYVIYTIIIFIIFILNLMFISKEKWLTLNLAIDLNSYMAEYDYDKLRAFIPDKYIIKEKEEETSERFIRSIEYEKKLIAYAKEVTVKLFDNSFSSDDMMYKYFRREPFRIFGFSESFYTSEYMVYLKNYNNFNELKNKIIDNNLSFESISDVKLYYAYPDYYVIQVYLNNVNTMGNTILQYKIIKEESSDMLKVSNVLYFNEDYISECYDKDSNIKRFNLDISDENYYITDSEVLDIYNKYYYSIVKINVYKEDEIIDRVTGFFINDNVIVTTFDIFNRGIFEKYKYEIVDYSGEKYSYKGMISFSGYYNLAVIEIDERVGKPVKLGYPVPSNIGESVIVPSFTGNIYVGTLNEIMDDGTYIINSNLLLNSIDRGSPIINSNGDLIGVNTRINLNSNLLISVKHYAILNVYNNLMADIKNSVDTFTLNPSIIEIR